MPKQRYRADPSSWLPRVLARNEACRFGLSPSAVDRRLAAGVWVRLAPGVYCTAPPGTDADLLIAANLHGGVGSCLSGAAGLVTHHFRCVTEWERALTLVPLGAQPRSTGRIQVRPTPHMPATAMRDGIRVAAAERCVIDHGVTLRRLDDARALVAEAVQRHRCSPQRLERALLTAPQRGSKAVRQAIADVAAGARSAPEARAATTFRNADLPPWRLNAPVTCGGRHFVLDFWFEQLRAGIEIDGEEWHRYGSDWDATLTRDAVLQTAGIALLHVQPSLTRTDDGLLGLVVPWLRRRALDRGINWTWQT